MAPSLPACGQMGKCDNRHQGQVPVTPPGQPQGKREWHQGGHKHQLPQLRPPHLSHSPRHPWVQELLPPGFS